MYGKKIICTPLPYLEELPESDKNLIILNFDLSNIKEVVEKIKSLISQNNAKATNYVVPYKDNYNKYLAKGKSKYEKEKYNGMKKIRAKVKFKDMKHNNLLRLAGEEFVEDEERADDLIRRGFATLVEEIKPKVEKAVTEIETAVKEEKKEKAIKETAKKVVKKNAKK